ncbi:MAG TPA: maltose ABC transporter substrate-binding protein, partial [Ilumatobacteraceae bacterium]|nr:maltose ABC transporter substrate-binding protein [Ilumatobacteraceae bacterium]
DTTATTEAATATTEAATDATTTETTEYQAPPRGDADLVIWADDTRAPVLEPIAAAFSEAEGVTVQVVEVPFDEIRDQLSIAGPAGEGPDIVTGAHDWLGELVSNGVVAPIDLGADAELYAPVAIEAFTYDGALYGVPYAIENIALIRNVDLVPEAPATFEDLEATALALQADGTVGVPLGLQQDPGDPYHNYPLFSALGGYVFGENEDGTYNADDVGIDSEGGLVAAQKFADWSNEGLISKDVSSDISKDAFLSGDTPFMITGPWNTGDFTDAGLNFVVEPIPPVAGGTPEVFVGVQGFMQSAFSENADLATTFMVDYLGTEEVQLALFDAGGRPPAMLSALEKVSDDPIIKGFGAAGGLGTPLPAIPEMSAVWESWTDAYSLIFTGSDPVQAFTDAATQIRDKIAEG